MAQVKSKIVGRIEEQAILHRVNNSAEAELVAVYGRRRVGKTFLIESYFHEQLFFSCSGQYKGKLKDLLGNFTEQLKIWFPETKFIGIPENWTEAFRLLREQISHEKINPGRKKVIFIDEMPWMETPRSGFLSAFSYFWNIFASKRQDLIVVICGSAASWIISKVINDRGGLHNRVTQRIRLLPFNLGESEEYVKRRGVHLSRYQLTQLYMVTGGVPAYLNAVKPARSIPQIIEDLCFSKDGVLAGEFNNLFSSLFSNAEKHIDIVKALTKRNQGLSRSELLLLIKTDSGGGLSTVLDELSESGFILKTLPFGKKEKDSLYRLIDEFTFFYMRFMDQQRSMNTSFAGAWDQARFAAWSGYAFENVCMKHIGQVKIALGISGVATNISSWKNKAVEEAKGAQIDLIIDRADGCLNICEIKFSTSPFTITNSYARILDNKLVLFRSQSKESKGIILTMITTFGVADNEYRRQLAPKVISLDALFEMNIR